MSSNKYALRANTFGYNDEYYNIYDGSVDGRICGLYDTREAAIEAWKKLEHQKVSKNPLGNVQEFIELPEEKLQELDNFVFEHCGEHIVNDGWLDEECETIIAKMTVEQVFEFLNKAELCAYTLVEYQPTNDKFYVWWLAEKETYICSSEELGLSGGVCQASSVEALFNNYNWFLESYLEEQDEGDYCHFKGTLEEISHSPEILRTLIATKPNIDYDEAEQSLTLRDVAVLKEVYPLLIHPPIEVREVTLEQIIEIEKNLPE
jgi:hypothetical protein